MASTSTKGWPFSTRPPFSCRKRTTLPVTSVRSSEGSNTLGKYTVPLSMATRSPSGSSRPTIFRVAPPNVASKLPSGWARSLARHVPPAPAVKAKVSGAVRVTSNAYLMDL